MLRRRFLAALGLAPAALLPVAQTAEHEGPLIRGITFDGVLSVGEGVRALRIEGCSSTGNHDVPFRIVVPSQA